MSFRNIKLTDLNLLSALYCLLETRSVSRAAQRVGVTQSAMSRTLGRLRLLFADPLLVREGQEMRLTPRAATLHEPLIRALSEIEALLTLESDFEPAQTQRMFRLAISGFAQIFLISKLQEVLEREAPHAIFSFYQPEDHSVKQLAENVLDLVIRCRSENDPSTLRSQTIYKDDFICLVRKKHPILRERFTVENYAGCDHLLISPLGGEFGLIDEYLRKLKLSRRIKTLSSSFALAPYLLESSNLVVTLPRMSAINLSEKHGLRQLELPFKTEGIEIVQFWHERRDNDSSHQWIRRLIYQMSRSLYENVSYKYDNMIQ